MKSSEISFYIETLGCPKNIVDSRTMRSNLLQNGFKQSYDPENADVILINTCSFIKEAQESTIETIFDVLKIKNKKKNKNRKVGIVGCFAQQFPGEIEKEIPEVDFIMGTGKYHEISHLISQKFSIELKPLAFGDSITKQVDRPLLPPHAYFRIAQGCSRKCAFCIIPKIRGNLINFSLEEMKKQYKEEMAARTDDSPLREAIFVSQDTISTSIEDLRQFVEFFQNIEHIKWIRIHYLFPDKRVFEILKLMKQFSKIVPYLDIPFQHISAAILKKMNRPDDIELFKDIIKQALILNPEIEIRTAFIIGFPGETDQDVECIADFLRNQAIHKCSFFRYSHEIGTSAYENFKDDVPDDIKVERINYLREIHIQTRNELRARWIGQKTQLMLDEINPNEIIARRPQDSPDIDEVVYIRRDPKSLKKDYKSGDIVEGCLDNAMEYDWIGEITNDYHT
ncbi:MAG: MiaB/RimO family radical SAM methylthiotransferase [Spirochaetia bacterium]|nr:MiaB/RimO family radical SAM methylthiotransferase [Spirochaetia bacterium]